MDFIVITASEARAFSTATWYFGNATADNIPMINTTTNSSIKVKPLFIFLSEEKTSKKASQ